MMIIASTQRQGAALMIRVFVYRNAQLLRPSACAPGIDTSRKSPARILSQGKNRFPADRRVPPSLIRGSPDRQPCVRREHSACSFPAGAKDRDGSTETLEPLQSNADSGIRES